MADTSQVSYTEKVILGSVRELWASTGVPAAIDVNTTLNSKYDVKKAVAPTKLTTIGLFGIGIYGFRNTGDTMLSNANAVLKTNMDLYLPIPFRVVPVEEDLTASERSNYRLRRVKNINNTDYALYYLKRLTYSDSVVRVTTTDPNTSNETDYVFDYGNLKPTPPTTSSTGVSTTSQTEVNVTVNAIATITGAEVVEAVNVLYEGDLRYAKVSEMGIYSGEDVQVTANDYTGASFNYTESMYTQLNIHHTNLGVTFAETTRVENFGVRFGRGDVIML